MKFVDQIVEIIIIKRARYLDLSREEIMPIERIIKTIKVFKKQI